jgi:hypothetical protein
VLGSLLVHDDEKEFNGCLIWLRQWGIWGETTEAVARLTIENLRCSEEALEATPAHLIEASEFVVAHALVTYLLLFQWDGYLIAPDGEWFAFISHDESVFFLSRTDIRFRNLEQRFRDWHPQRNTPSYLRA